MSNRDTAIEVVRQLPEEASFEEIPEPISFLAARCQADAGRTVPHDEVERKIESWLTR